MAEPPMKAESAAGMKSRPSITGSRSGSGRKQVLNPCKSLDEDELDAYFGFSSTKNPNDGASTAAHRRATPDSVVLSDESTIKTRKRSVAIFFVNAFVFLVVNIVVFAQHLTDDSGTEDRWQLSRSQRRLHPHS